jgi:hypothetical protein
MGGWSILDYALHHSGDPWPLLRLGYASILSSWALVNSGPPETDCGYWYPGPENDGGAGGGFEPAPYGTTWLGQPHGRGSWYYACEIDLGFGGALRAAATVLVDDPLFGPFAYGGSFERTAGGWLVRCRDGVRRRFHAILQDLMIHVEVERDHFAADIPLELDDGASRIAFVLQSSSSTPHATPMELSGLLEGGYAITVDGARIGRLQLRAGEAIRVDLPVTRFGARVEIAREAR